MCSAEKVLTRARFLPSNNYLQSKRELLYNPQLATAESAVCTFLLLVMNGFIVISSYRLCGQSDGMFSYGERERDCPGACAMLSSHHCKYLL